MDRIDGISQVTHHQISSEVADKPPQFVNKNIGSGGIIIAITERAGGHLPQVCLILPESIAIDNLVSDPANVHNELPGLLSHWSKLHSDMYLGLVQQG
ncbi:hypothetical protein ACTXT7_002150 [Hymenolepis weldensis]